MSDGGEFERRSVAVSGPKPSAPLVFDPDVIEALPDSAEEAVDE
jgi:hypothetical protein